MSLILFIACGQGQIKTPESSMPKFEEFKRKEKFIPDEKLFYPGIGDPTQKLPQLVRASCSYTQKK